MLVTVNARPLLERVARALVTARLEAVLVGNAGAALHGAPVTTVDFDPYDPASDLFRVVNDEIGLQLDFMSRLDGIRSFEALRARGTSVTLGGADLLVADLRDIIRSKRAANRPRDRAMLSVLEATLREKEKSG